LGREVKKAVITVPAYFDDTSRQATKDAARIAGLEILRLINEPTAAALAYGLDKGAEGIYAIYDLGGGTFDISILRMEKGVFQVLATGGDAHLGGDDFDNEIEKLRNRETKNSQFPDFSISRQIKEKLTEATEYMGITRAQLELAVAPLVERTIKICAKALADSGLAKADIKGVVMVGGSTRMPLVQQKVGEFFGTKPLTDINPDEVVALGAAIQAEALVSGSNNLLLDVIPLSLGLETMHGIAEKIIWRNTAIPCTYAQEFTTYENNQTGMIIHVVQGERENVADCRSLARFELKNIPALPAGVARIKITFNVDADGLLTVAAEELRTGQKQQIEVKPSYGLDEKQIERMILESMEKGQADMASRLLAESKTEAERLLISLKPALEKYSVKDAPIYAKIEQLEAAIKTSDRKQIDTTREELNHLSESIAEQIMNAEIGKALEGKNVGNI
jgi:molecular chaperone HscA